MPSTSLVRSAGCRSAGIRTAAYGQCAPQLAGHANLVSSTLFGINALAASGSAAHDLRVVSRPEANMLLAAALRTVGAELGAQQAASGPPVLLTETDGERLVSARNILRDGVALARSVSPS